MVKLTEEALYVLQDLLNGTDYETGRVLVEGVVKESRCRQDMADVEILTAIDIYNIKTND